MAVPYLLTFGWEQRYKIKNASHKKWYNTPSTPYASGAPPLSSPPTGLGYYYKGTFYPASGKSGADIYVEIISSLIQDFPDFAKKFSISTAGHKRYYLFQKGERALSEDELKFYREIPGGWLLCVNLSNAVKHQKLRQAAEIVGLPYDDETGIKVVGF